MIVAHYLDPTVILSSISSTLKVKRMILKDS